MRILIPADVTDTNFVSSTIPENDHPAWAVGTTYDRGDFVISTNTHSVYRSLVDSNVGTDPDVELAAFADPLTEDPAERKWQLIGATNRWRMFDKKPSTVASRDDSIVVEVSSVAPIGGVAAFNVSAFTAQVEILDAANVVIYDKTVVMQDESLVIDWYSYYFSPIFPLSEFTFLDAPPFGDVTVRLTLTRTGETASCGQFVFGPVIEVGETLAPGTGFRGYDFSFVEQNEFGDLTTVRRPATRVSDFEVHMTNATLLGFDALMRALRGGVPVVWVGADGTSASDQKAAINYGFYRDYRVMYQTDAYSVLSLQIQGIV